MTLQGWHVHVYFNAQSLAQARQLCEQAAKRFALTVGRMHERPVGPHPQWSCQLSFGPELFGEALPWLLLNRAGLTLLAHPITGDDLVDHPDHALWLGEPQSLDLSVFT